MWQSKGKKDYTAVQLEGITSGTGYDNSKTRRRQSCWRYWNQLSSLQRSIIFLIIVLGTVCGVYIIPSLYSDLMDKEEVDNLSRKGPRSPHTFHPGGLPIDPKFARNAIEEIKKKAKQKLTKEKLNDTVVDKKRGPPSLRDRRHRNKPEAPVEQIQKPIEAHGDPFAGPQNKQQEAVVKAFKHAWSAYKKYAWGRDELKPMSKSYETWFNVGLTLIDSLDTMYIMGLKEEFKEARAWVANDLTFDVNRDVNLFEATIRVLGGLLSSYHLSKDRLFLEKAKEFGDRLLPAFKSPSGIPYSDVNIKTGNAHPPRWGPDSSTSEVTTIQLEFTDLSRATGNPKYENAVDAVTSLVHALPKKDGLVPMFINAHSGHFRSSSTITLGARADSYYEYLLKMWLQTGKTDTKLKEDYVEAVNGMKKHLLRESVPNRLMYFGELLSGHSFSPKMDHLVCYLAGTLALGAQNGLDQEHLDLGKKLAYTCYQMYARMPTKLSPEIAHFNMVEGAQEDIIVKPADTHNLERPETVESLFYLYRITGDQKYRDWGWQIFQAFEKYTKLPEGYSSISNVRNPGNVGFRNKMESFFLGETLKYFYLLFSDNPALIPLDKYVFNTEAHPLPIHKS